MANGRGSAGAGQAGAYMQGRGTREALVEMQGGGGLVPTAGGAILIYTISSHPVKTTNHCSLPARQRNTGSFSREAREKTPCLSSRLGYSDRSCGKGRER